jgi:hypothetical protein
MIGRVPTVPLLRLLSLDTGTVFDRQIDIKLRVDYFLF